MRTIGSSAGLYADQSIPLQERATRLLRDTASAIHEKILEEYTSPKNLKFGASVIESLDALLDAANEVKVEGDVSNETQATASENDFAKSSFTVSANAKSPQFNFGSLSNSVNQIVANMPNKRLWILLDEWSEVPLDLQPYLADMIRRGFLAVRGVTAKFAAIEHRSVFRKVSEDGSLSVGIELGADVSTSLNLDDYMVFENNPQAASSFFSEMMFRHIKTSAERDNLNFDISTKDELIKLMFTQKDAFDEFVMAAEGVPRDAINILKN
jgi:hypothetical protein